MLALLLIVISLCSHIYAVPFLDDSADMLEFLSLSVSFLTFFCGLLLWEPDVTSLGRQSISIIIVFSNLIFLLYALYLTYRAAKSFYDKNGSLFTTKEAEEGKLLREKKKEEALKEMYVEVFV